MYNLFYVIAQVFRRCFTIGCIYNPILYDTLWQRHKQERQSKQTDIFSATFLLLYLSGNSTHRRINIYRKWYIYDYMNAAKDYNELMFLVSEVMKKAGRSGEGQVVENVCL